MAVQPCRNEFKLKRRSRTTSRTSSSSSSCVPNTVQWSLDDYVINDVKLKAEIIWVLKCVLAGYSNRSCDELDKSFARMFPDSDLAQKFKLSRQKAMYLVTYGIAPYFKLLLQLQLAKSESMSFHLRRVLTVFFKFVRWMLFCVIGVMKIIKLILLFSFWIYQHISILNVIIFGLISENKVFV